MATPATADDKTTQPEQKAIAETQPRKKPSEDGRRAHSAGPGKPRRREFMLDAPPRNYEKRHFPDILYASLTPPWAVYSSSESFSEAEDIEEDSLADEIICEQFAGDFPVRHASAFEPYLSPAARLEPLRVSDGSRWSLEFPPKYIILPTSYFGLKSISPVGRVESSPAFPGTGRYRRQPLKRHASLTDRPPFYPPGPNQQSVFATGTPSRRSQRMQEARQLYHSPKSRRALGTPACYKASSSLSSLRSRVSPVWNAQASSRSLSGSIAKRNMAQRTRQLKSEQGEKSRRDFCRSEPQLTKVATHSKPTRSGREKKKMTLPVDKTSPPVDCANWLSRNYMPARYYDVPTEVATSKRYPLRPTESFLPRKTTLWYRSDPDLALTTTDSEQEERMETIPTAVQMTACVTYQTPTAYFRHRKELQLPAYEREDPLVPRRLASSPIQINRTYTKSQRLAYRQELNNLREGLTVKSSTDTAPKMSTEERFPTYKTLSSVKAASNASAIFSLDPPKNVPKARPAENFVSQLPPPLDDNASDHFSRTSARLSEIENTSEADRPPVTLKVPPLAPLTSSKNQVTISCRACGKYVDIKERMELLNDIFHRFCFKCAVCGEELSSTNAILCNNKWTCERHSDFQWPAIPDQISKPLPV